MRHLPVAICLTLALPALTHAHGMVDNDSLSLSVTSDNSNALQAGIDTCQQLLSDRLTLVGTADADALRDEGQDATTNDHLLRLMASITVAPVDAPEQQCAWTTVSPESCGEPSSWSSTCACLAQNQGQESINTTVNFDDILKVGCSADSALYVYLYTEYVHLQDPDNPDDVPAESDFHNSGYVTITVDLERPPAPPTAPIRVDSDDRALQVELARVNDSDVAGYQICYRVKEEGESAPDPVTEGDTVDLVDGFTCFNSLITSSSTIPNLINEQAYWVTYATVDFAGNRSANSPALEGTPRGVRSFADIYSSYNGANESGGCNTAPNSSNPALWLLGLIALPLLRRRR